MAHTAASTTHVVQRIKGFWLQHQLSYVNSPSGVQRGPLIKPELKITLSLSLILELN